MLLTATIVMSMTACSDSKKDIIAESSTTVDAVMDDSIDEENVEQAAVNQEKKEYESITQVKFDMPTEIEKSDIYVEPIDGISDDFYRGMDASEVLALENSGVKYFNENGEDQDVFMTLAQAGVNCIRIRVWNNPYNENGQGYGGGNNDVATAVELGRRATKYSMKTMIDFHYSDFWADPNRQLCPKAWKDMKIEEKTDALYQFTYDSLKEMLDAGVDIDSVQVGNETNYGMAGETDLDKVAALMSAGSKAIRELSDEYDRDIKVVIHYTNANSYDQIDGLLNILERKKVDYDILGLSYYAYWHGKFETLTKTMEHIKKDFNKDVMIVETSYPYTTEDGDGTGNTAAGGEMVDGYTSSVQSQATLVRDICQLVQDVDGLGVFYWGGIWIPVGSDKVTNAPLWEKYGSGWATSAASKYDPENVGNDYGGCAWDNQAMFDFEGKPLASLNVFKYLKYGSEADEAIDYVQNIDFNVLVGKELKMPETVPAVYNNRALNKEISVKWNEADVEKIDTTTEGEYMVVGTAENDAIVQAKVTVGYVNIAQNPSFEEEDTSMWNVTYENAANPTDYQKNEADAHSGDTAFHFWSKDNMDFQIEQTMTDLENGTYGVSVFSQGGDMNSDCELILYAVADGKEYTVDFMDKGWAQWQNPEISDIVVSDGQITFGVRMKCNANSWGTLDDFKLYKIN